jgi:hypothetical protein
MRAYFEKVLVPVPDKKDRAQIEALVARCLTSDSVESARLEKEINKHVAALYEGHGKLLESIE